MITAILYTFTFTVIYMYMYMYMYLPYNYYIFVKDMSLFTVHIKLYMNNAELNDVAFLSHAYNSGYLVH